MEFESKIKSEELQQLNDKVKSSGYVDREHLMEFLTLIPTNDGQHIVREVKQWLTTLHDSTDYATVTFPDDDINAIISDLDSYGKVSTNTILEFKQGHSKTVSMS